jgi:hypothetical protein
MLYALEYRNKFSARKGKLFSAAVCRRIWRLLTDERSRQAVEVAERYADGLATLPELTAAFEDARAASLAAVTPFDEVNRAIPGLGLDVPHLAVVHAADDRIFPPRLDAERCAHWATHGVFEPGSLPRSLEEAQAVMSVERAAQLALLRDITRNPFRPPPSLSPSLLTWNGGTIPILGQAAYDDRHLPAGHLRPERLAVLADALEDAGCTDADLLGHLRDEGPHVRGCWVLDLLLRRS